MDGFVLLIKGSTDLQLSRPTSNSLFESICEPFETNHTKYMLSVSDVILENKLQRKTRKGCTELQNPFVHLHVRYLQ